MRCSSSAYRERDEMLSLALQTPLEYNISQKCVCAIDVRRRDDTQKKSRESIEVPMTKSYLYIIIM